MLKGLGILHTPDLLYTLAAMGHGDEIAILDCHFPAASLAKRLVRLDGADVPQVVEACLQLLPLDTFVEHPAIRMLVAPNPLDIPQVQKQCQQRLSAVEPEMTLEGISRNDFYERARVAFAIVITGETRTYGCILLKKGLVFPQSY